LAEAGAEGLITFLYYRDLRRAAGFYEEIMGFELTVDQGWAKIYRVLDGAYVDLVDERRGYHRASPTKPVMIAVVVPDVDAWYRSLKERGWRPSMSRAISRRSGSGRSSWRTPRDTS